MKKYFVKIIGNLNYQRTENGIQSRRLYILNIILNAIIFLISIGTIIIAYNLIVVKPNNYENQSFSLFFILIILVLFITIRLISFKGYGKFSAHALTIILFFLATYISFIWGVDSQAGILFYALVIVISGILIGAKFSIISAFVISFASYLINDLHQKQIVKIDRSWIYESWSNSDITMTSIILLTISIVLWLFNRELKRSEMELKNERDLLEIRVEEKTAELKITQAKEIAQIYHFAEFGKLSSGLFHDLINPLTALMLNINKVKIDSENEPSFNHIKMEINQAIKASEKMKNYIISVRKQINFQNEASNQKEQFSLNQEIEEALMILNYKAKRKKVEMVFAAESNIKIFGDPVKFNQIITNLLSNAIDAYEENTSNKEINITLNKTKDFINLIVSDHGKGIPKEIANKIFEPFFTTKNEGGNLGLGLSFIKQVVERDFGGIINVNSELFKGTTFIIKLPAN